MNLYKIDAAIAETIESMFDSVNDDGEISAGTVEAFENLKIERAEKLDAIGAYLKNLTAEADAIGDEIKALQARKKVKENQIERLKNYVSDSLQNANESKFESSRVVFSFRKSESVNILNLEFIPTEFLKPVEPEPDKTAIKKALKNGAIIWGAELVTKNNLQIK